MADTKISALTDKQTPVGTEQIPVNDSGTNKRVSATNLKKYIQFWDINPVTEGDSPADASASLSERIYTNTGASATVQIILPTTPVLGMAVDFCVTAAHDLQVVANGTQVIKIGASASSAGGTFTASAVGAYLQLRYVAADLWLGVSSGTWTAA